MVKIVRYLREIGLGIHISDKTFIKNHYKKMFGNSIDLDNPKTFNEKMNWLKLNDRKKIYTKMVDKYEAKILISKIIGKEYIVPTIGVWDDVDEIDFDKLPEQFVLKCTHDSGGIFICNNKKDVNFRKIKFKFRLIMKRNFYYRNREWPYKNVKPRIIAEKYLENRNNKSLTDYKFLCFNGEPKLLYVSDDSHTENQKIAFFDMDYNQLPIKRTDYKDYDVLPTKPINFEKMKKLSKKLSKGIPHLRVDWYEVNGELFFGELTLTTCGGFIPFEDHKWDVELGKMIELPRD